MKANKENVVLRSEKGVPVSYTEMDTNLVEVKNVIDDVEALEDKQSVSSRANSIVVSGADGKIDREWIGDDIVGEIAGIKAEIRNWYYGPLATDPTTRPDGTSMQVGDEYHHTSTSARMVFNGTAWVDFIGALRTDLANATDPAKGAGMVGYANDRIADGAGGTIQRKLDAIGIYLDDVPHDADAGVWINNAINVARLAGADFVQLPTDGRTLVVNTTIRLKRGIALRGGATIDDSNGTLIRRGDNMNAPVIATDKWFDSSLPVEAHYYVATGITIDGNASNQTEMKEAIAYWGVFVGSYLDDIFVLNNFGPAISFAYAYDCYIGKFWANNCVTGDRAILEIDQGRVASGPIGMLEIDSIYLENPKVSIGGGNVRETATNRGVAIKAGNIGKLSISSIHAEGVDTVFQLTHGLTDSMRVGMCSVAWCGDPDRKNALVYVESSGALRNVHIGPCKTYMQKSGYYWVRPSESVQSSNLIPSIASTSTRWGGLSSTFNCDPHSAQNHRFYGSTERRRVNQSSDNYNRIFVVEDNPAAYHYENGVGAFWNFGSRMNQGADKVFTRIESYGNSGDRLIDFVPRTLPTVDSTSVQNCLFVTAGGELRARVNGVTYKVGLTPV